MKKFCILALSLVLTAALFAGCGCTNTNTDNTTTPTVMTEPMPTVATTLPTTRPTVMPTVPTTEADTGNGALEDHSAGNSGTTAESTTPAQSEDANGVVRGRARGVVPNSGK